MHLIVRGYFTKKIDIINTLLDEINFNRIYCNADGVFVISAYKEPVANNITWEYSANSLSIIGRDTQSNMDYFNIALDYATEVWFIYNYVAFIKLGKKTSISKYIL
jgi:hypothetical protein